jgi:hypothetical protein
VVPIGTWLDNAAFVICGLLNFKYQTQSGFSFASVVADYGEPYGRTEHYGELGEISTPKLHTTKTRMFENYRHVVKVNTFIS